MEILYWVMKEINMTLAVLSHLKGVHIQSVAFKKEFAATNLHVLVPVRVVLCNVSLHRCVLMDLRLLSHTVKNKSVLLVTKRVTW